MRGLPRNVGNNEATLNLICEDAQGGMRCHVFSDAIPADAWIGPTSIGTVAKKDRDRALSRKQRMLNELRRIYMAANARLVYPTMAREVKRFA